jgi:MFS family permease
VDQSGGEAGELLAMWHPRWLSWEWLKGWRAHRRRLGLVSPPISGVLSFIGGVSGYLPLWAAGLAPSRSSGLAVAMAGVGLGRVIGPIVASRVAAWFGLRRGLPASVICLSVILGIILLASLRTTSDGEAVGTVVALFVLLGAATASSLTLLITLRQTELSGSLLARATGRAHAFSAAGSIIGAWAGVALDVPSEPALGLGLSAATAALLAVWMIRQEHPSGMVPRSPRAGGGGEKGAG